MAEFIENDSIKVEDLKGYFHKGKHLNKTVQKTVPGVINKVIAESLRQGVDPHAALAQTWMESMFGTVHREGLQSLFKQRPDFKLLRVANPMQYNAKNLSPPVQKDELHMRNAYSERVWDAVVEKELRKNPNFVDARNKYTEASKDTPSYVEPSDEAKFQKARMLATGLPIRQDMYIRGGVDYLKKMIEENPGRLEDAFMRYRGKGRDAAKSGRHIKQLYNTLKNNTEIQQLIDTQRMGA